DRFESIAQLEPRGAQRRPTVVGERAPDRQAVAARDLGLGADLPLHGALEWTHPAHHLLQLLLGVPIGLIDWPGGFPEIVELAELMGDPGQCARDGPPDRLLAVRDYAQDRDR